MAIGGERGTLEIEKGIMIMIKTVTGKKAMFLKNLRFLLKNMLSIVIIMKCNISYHLKIFPLKTKFTAAAFLNIVCKENL